MNDEGIGTEMKECVQVLKALRRCPNYIFEYSAATHLPPGLNMDQDTFRLTVDYLVSKGYLIGHDTNCALTFQGLHYKLFAVKSALSYIAVHWIDFLALVTAVIALIVSLR